MAPQIVWLYVAGLLLHCLPPAAGYRGADMEVHFPVARQSTDAAAAFGGASPRSATPLGRNLTSALELSAAAARHRAGIPKDVAALALNTSALGLVILTGVDRQEKLQSSILAITAWFVIFIGVLPSCFVGCRNPELAPEDFRTKGTLSNLAQDAQTPHGRLWTAALAFAAVLLLISMYPFWIYRCWAPWVDIGLHHGALQSAPERLWRSLWIILPNVGFMLTAVIPSLSVVEGYDFFLTMVHNVCAPLSMGFCLVMETVQLGFGENAFSYFFSSEPTPAHGPLTSPQRVRVLVLQAAWLTCTIFVSIQAYLFLRPERTTGRAALRSFVAEVSCMLLAFALPALAGVDAIIEDLRSPSVHEQVKQLIGNMIRDAGMEWD